MYPKRLHVGTRGIEWTYRNQSTRQSRQRLLQIRRSMGCVRLKVLKVEIHSRATPSGRGNQSSQSTRWSASISEGRVKKRTHWLKGLVSSVWKCTSTKHLNQRSGESCGCQRDYRYPDAPSWWADETWCGPWCGQHRSTHDGWWSWMWQWWEQSRTESCLSVWKCTSPKRQKMFTKPGTSLGEPTAVSTNPIRPVCQEVREWSLISTHKRKNLRIQGLCWAHSPQQSLGSIAQGWDRSRQIVSLRCWGRCQCQCWTRGPKQEVQTRGRATRSQIRQAWKVTKTNALSKNLQQSNRRPRTS